MFEGVKPLDSPLYVLCWNTVLHLLIESELMASYILAWSGFEPVSALAGTGMMWRVYFSTRLSSKITGGGRGCCADCLNDEVVLCL